MELVIDGITKLHFKTFEGRTIAKIEVKDRGGDYVDNAYVFTFGEIRSIGHPYIHRMGKSWNSEFEVWLGKFPNQFGKYELFVMGLHSVTCYDIDLSEVRSMFDFCKHMNEVLRRYKAFLDS